MGLGEVLRIVRSVLSTVLSLGIWHCTPLSCVRTVLMVSRLCPAAPPSPLGLTGQAGHTVGVDGLSRAPDVTDEDHAVIPTPVGVLLVQVEVPSPDQADHHCAAGIRLLPSPQHTVRISLLPHLHQVLLTVPPSTTASLRT